jgi:hypothetical protein
LKKEIEVLEAKKSRLLVEVGGLSATRANAKNLRKEVESLRKEVEDARGVKAVSAERASKAARTAESLRKAIDAEKELGLMLQQQVGLLTRCLEATKELGLTMVKMYVDTLGQFGSSTFDLPEEPTAFSLFTWRKAHLEKLPTFIGGAADFGALAGTTNFAKMVHRGGVLIWIVLKRRNLRAPPILGRPHAACGGRSEIL